METQTQHKPHIISQLIDHKILSCVVQYIIYYKRLVGGVWSSSQSGVASSGDFTIFSLVTVMSGVVREYSVVRCVLVSVVQSVLFSVFMSREMR